MRLDKGTGQVGLYKVTTTLAAAAGSVSIPANSYIHSILIKNTTANAVTGGVKVGTTSGAVDVVAATAVGANALVFSTLLKTFFSTTAAQTLFIDTVTLWNSASVDVTVIYGQL